MYTWKSTKNYWKNNMVRILGVSCLQKKKWLSLRLSVERKLKLTHWLYLNLLTKGNYSHLIKFNIPKKYKRQVQRIRKRSPGFSRLSNKNSWRLIRRIHFMLKHYWAQEGRGIRITKDLVKIRITNTRETPEAFILKSKKGYFAKTAITLNFIWPNSTYITKLFTFNLLRLINLPLMYYDRKSLSLYFSENIIDNNVNETNIAIFQRDVDKTIIKINEETLDLDMLKAKKSFDNLYYNAFDNSKIYQNLLGKCNDFNFVDLLKNTSNFDFNEHADAFVNWQRALNLNLNEDLLLKNYKTHYHNGIENFVRSFLTDLIKIYANFLLTNKKLISKDLIKIFFNEYFENFVSKYDSFHCSIMKKIIFEFVPAYSSLIENYSITDFIADLNLNELNNNLSDSSEEDNSESDSDIESDEDLFEAKHPENFEFDLMVDDFDYTGGVSKLLTPLEEENDDWL